MAHAFDTKLVVPQRTAILNGVIALLQPLLIANGGYLASVIPFGAVVRSYTDEDGLKMLYEALGGQTPAVAVALGSRAKGQAIGNGGFSWTSGLELLLYFATNNMRDPAVGRLLIDAAGVAANASDPGLHVMMEHAEELVVGKRCGNSTTIKQVIFDREEELATLDEVTLWLQTYQVLTTRNINPDRGVTQMLKEIHWRTSAQAGEVLLPNAPTKPTTIDAFSDGLDQ